MTDHDQTDQRRTAQRRTKRRLGVLAAVLAGSTAVGVAAGAGAFGRGAAPDPPIASVLLIAAGAALVVAGILVVVWKLQKRVRDAPLMMGADRATQRRVRVALRRGHTDDPEVDVLARDLIERSRTPRWFPFAYLLFAAFFLTLGFLGDRDTGDTIRSAVLVTLSLAASVAFWRHLRRLRDYRGLTPERPDNSIGAPGGSG